VNNDKVLDIGPSYHGTKIDLKQGYLLEPSFKSNLTDKKFPGNPTKSYRTKSPLRVVGKVVEWEGHSPEVLHNMLDNLEKLKQLGIETIND
jgi:hypothetical protein